MSPSPQAALTAEKVLVAAEDVVRRHGADRATVVDVAQALGVSHASIYRFYPTKAALREAVVARWLNRTVEAQAALATQGPAADRLKAWFESFLDLKRAQRQSDPELFEAFRQLSAEAKSSVEVYKERLVLQLAALAEAGMAEGTLVQADPVALGRTLMTAMTKFHHPAFGSAWEDPKLRAEFEPLWALLARGILSERNLP